MSSVAQRGTASALAASVTATLTSSPAVGNLILVSAAIYYYDYPVNPTVVDSAGQAYTMVAPPAINGSRLGSLWFYRKNTAGGVTSVTLNVTVADYIRIHVYEIGAADTTNPINANAQSMTDVSSSAGSIDLTTTAANTVVFGNFSGGATSVASPGTGWTLGYTDESVAAIPVTLSDVYKIVTAAGLYGAGISWSPNQAVGYSAAAVAIKEAGGAVQQQQQMAMII